MEFLSFLEKDANKQLEDSLAIMKKINSEMSSIAEKRKSISTPSGSDSANKKLIDDNEKLKTATAGLQKQIDKLRETEAKKIPTTKAVNELEKERNRIIKELDKTQAKITVATEQNTIALQTQKSVLKATAGSYAELNEKQKRASEYLQNLIVRGKTAEQTQRQYNKELKIAQKEFDTLNKKLLEADKAVGKWNRSSERTVAGLRELASVLGWSGVLYAIKDLALNIFNTTRLLESQDLALKNVVGSSYEFLRAQRFLKETSAQYGLEIKQLTTQYAQFFVNAKSKLSRPEIEKIFGSIAKSAGFMGLTLQQQDRAFLALNQMMSKGTVQAEELRGQLAEALPGAVQAMVRAYQTLHPEMKVTERSFMKLMKDGKIISSEILPQMTIELEKLYGIETKERIGTITSALNSLGNAWTNLVRALDAGDSIVARAFGRFSSGLERDLNKIAEYLKSDEQKRKEHLQNIGQIAEESARKLKASKGTEIQQEEWSQKKLDAIYRKRNALYEKAKQVQEKAVVWDKDKKEKANFIKTANEQLARYDGYIRGLLKFKKDNGIEEDAGDKQKKRIRLNYEEAKSLSDLLIARLEQQRAIQKDLMDNEDATDFGRLEARKEYSRLSLEILEEQHKQENLMNELQRKEDLRKATETYNENKKNGFNDLQNANEYKKALKDINDKYNNLYQTSEVKLSTETRYLWIEDANFYNKIQKEKFEKAEADRKGHFEREQKLNDDILKLQTTRFNEIANNEKYLLITRSKAFESYKQLALIELDNERRRSLTGKETAQELDLINEKYRLQKEAIEKLVTPLQKAQEETRKYLDAFRQDQLKTLDDVGLSSAKIFLDFQKSIDENGNVYWQSTFDKMIEGAKDLKEEFKVVFSAVSEVAQEAFNIINQAGQASTQAEIDRLKIQYDTAWEFSDKSDVAKRKLDAEREKREKEIAQKEYKRKQNMAVVNIAIDTAQAIMSTYGQMGWIGGTAGAIFLGAMGLAQIALVKSQKMPEYYTGTENALEGFALTQERGREIIKDKHGKIKSLGSDKGAQVTWLDSGDKVLNNQRTMQELMFDKDLNNILANNNIAMPKIEMHTPKIDFSPVVDAINNQPIIIPDFDKLKTRIKRGNTIQTIEKAHTNFSSVKI